MMGSGFGSSDVLAVTQMQVQDWQNMQTVITQMMATDQAERMNRWKLLQDAQTKIFEINQEVTLNIAKTSKKLSDKWDQHILG